MPTLVQKNNKFGLQVSVTEALKMIEALSASVRNTLRMSGEDFHTDGFPSGLGTTFENACVAVNEDGSKPQSYPSVFSVSVIDV